MPSPEKETSLQAATPGKNLCQVRIPGLLMSSAQAEDIMIEAFTRVLSGLDKPLVPSSPRPSNTFFSSPSPAFPLQKPLTSVDQHHLHSIAHPYLQLDHRQVLSPDSAAFSSDKEIQSLLPEIGRLHRPDSQATSTLERIRRTATNQPLHLHEQHAMPIMMKKKGYKGVRQRKWDKWAAEVGDGKKAQAVLLGTCDDAKEAAKTYECGAYGFREPCAHLSLPNSIFDCSSVQHEMGLLCCEGSAMPLQDASQKPASSCSTASHFRGDASFLDQIPAITLGSLKSHTQSEEDPAHNYQQCPSFLQDHNDLFYKGSILSQQQISDDLLTITTEDVDLDSKKLASTISPLPSHSENLHFSTCLDKSLEKFSQFSSWDSLFDAFSGCNNPSDSFSQLAGNIPIAANIDDLFQPKSWSPQEFTMDPYDFQKSLYRHTSYSNSNLSPTNQYTFEASMPPLSSAAPIDSVEHNCNSWTIGLVD